MVVPVPYVLLNSIDSTCATGMMEDDMSCIVFKTRLVLISTDCEVSGKALGGGVGLGGLPHGLL